MSPPYPPLKSLRRPRLGLPDVYPQDPRQKEDELNAVHLKQGFTLSYCSMVSDEYGSAASKVPSQSNKILGDFKGILVKKKELNTFPGGSKRQTLNTKDNFTLVTPKTAKKAELWFKDLGSGVKSLHSLSKKVPILNKREDILLSLVGVPVRRAAWLIKMTGAYHTAMSEANKTKKRALLPDPASEWTIAIVKFLREQLSDTVNENSSSAETSYKQWIYGCELSEYMYYEGLLDRQEFLQWILELLEKTRYPDEPVLKIILPLALQYAKEFSQFELLSRKLAFQCAKKITYLVNDTEALNAGKDSNQTSSSGDNQGPHGQQHPLTAAFMELLNDPYYRFTILSLSSILQIITMDCPTALVWNYFGENKTPSSLLGSPLDLLPGVAPSSLPMPPNPNNSSIRQMVRHSELLIKERSAAAEVRWTTGERGSSHSKTGNTVSKILSVLEDLDSYFFERMDSASNTLESLYNRLFNRDQRSNDSSSDSNDMKDSDPREEEDSIIVHTLCTWAITSKRAGDHRGFVVAKLLEHRQTELSYNDDNNHQQQGEGDSSLLENSVQEDAPYANSYLFQNQLVYYLDNDAPTMSNNKQEFSNLILLFYELIVHDVFSHDHYLCTLISRGDLSNPIIETSKLKEDGEDRKINDDITSIVNEIKVGNQLEDPFSPPHEGHNGGISSREFDAASHSRHWQYMYHFPLPQDESSIHDCNQRYVLLYGAGRGKDDVSKNCKKLLKELLKLFSKKFSIDVSDGGKVKKQSKSEFIFDNVAQKFQNLSYYDQHSISHQCGLTVVEMLSSFSNLNGNYLPVAEYVSFLFDLAGLSLNIQGLLEWCLQILKELPGVEAQLIERSSSLARTYTTTMALYVVGVLRRYHTIFILNPSDVTTAFDYLCKISYRPKLPESSPDRRVILDCNSAEWCIFAYLYDLSCNCSLLKNRDKFHELKRHFGQNTDPSEATYTLTDRRFGIEDIVNPKKKVDPLMIKLLESPKNRYNFVCNVLIEVCETNDTEKLNDVAILCCEYTAQCNSLSSEWLGALTALCNAGASNVYADLLDQVSIRDSSIYNRLGIFISILIARHCFQLQSFVISVAIPSLLKAWDDVKDNSDSRNESEIGARVSCHLLLRLFKTVEPFQPMFYTMGSPQPMPRPSTHVSGIKCSCDRHLLAAAHRNITVGAIIAVLKAIMVLGDANNSSLSSYNSLLNLDASDDFGLGSIGLAGRMETASLSDFAKYTLRQICRQQWVHDRCLQVPDDLLKNGTLLDPMLSSKQAQTLLRLICSGSNSAFPDDDSHHKSISHILKNLDEWNLRISTVDVKLTYHQLTQLGSSDVSEWLDNVARAVIDAFHLSDNEDGNDGSSEPPDAKKCKISEIVQRKPVKYPSVWMIPYLVKHLKFLQNRVLKVVVEHLEMGNWSHSGNCKSGRQGGYMPFLQLVLTCIKELDVDWKDKKDKADKEELKENLLTSLHNQLATFLCFNKGKKLYNYEDPNARKRIQDALMLRFSLVGGLFETIMSSTNFINEWSTLLVQLIARGIVDLTNNSDLFTNVLDMLTLLIHSTLVSDREAGGSERAGEETRKHSAYHTLVKKLKKEIGDRNSISIRCLRQLLPVPKAICEAIISEPFGTVSDGKGNKVKGLNCDKKQGLQVSDKQKISPWDILEGHKNPAPLSWSWFAAVKHERKPLRYLEAFHELKYANNHTLEKPNSYFITAPPLPPEELEPSPKELKEEEESEARKINQLHPMMHGNNKGGRPMMMPNSNNMMPMGGQMLGGPQNMNSMMHVMQGPMTGGGPNVNMNHYGGSYPTGNTQYNNSGAAGGGPSGGNMMMGSSMRPPVGPMNTLSTRNQMINPQQHHTMIQQQRTQVIRPRGPHVMMQGSNGNQMMTPNMVVGNIPSGNNMYSQQMGGTSSNQWGGYNQSQQHQMYNNSNNFGNNSNNSINPMTSGSGPRYQGNSKQALQNMLRARHPIPSQFMNSGGNGQFTPPQQQQQQPQQQHQQQFRGNSNSNMRMQGGNNSMYHNNMVNSSTGNTGGGNNSHFNTMNQQYSNYTGNNGVPPMRISQGNQQQQQQYNMMRTSSSGTSCPPPSQQQQQQQMVRRGMPSSIPQANYMRNTNAYGNNMQQSGSYRPVGSGGNMGIPGMNSSNQSQLMNHLQQQQQPQMGYPQQQQQQQQQPNLY